ncbi:hypothetical protein CL653_03835 [bacterium]|nr:hypothetical protein [bacterium]|tara:strand:+ start:64 stop:435 length:372 start_codon:yes stop_codon:yes gene_type:complete
MKKTFLTSVSIALLTPVLAMAQSFDDGGDLGGFLGSLISFINDVLVPLIFALALLVFLYGVFEYFIIGKNLENKKEEGRRYMIWSIAGFVVMVSVLGIVNLFANGLGLKDDRLEDIPTLPTTR